jgi:hypothetical protein
MLPDVVETVVGGGTVVRGYPALVVERGAKGEAVVALRVLADAGARDLEHARGVGRLLLGEVALASGRVTSRWTGTQALTLAASPYRSTEALVADVQLAAVDALVPDAARIRDAEAYSAARTLLRDGLEDEVHRVVGHVVAALTAARTLDGEIRDATSLALLNTLTDLRDQTAGLVYDGFVERTPPARLPHLTRYLRAASYRLEKAQTNPHRDAELAWRVHDVEDAYDRARAAYAAGRPDPARAAARHRRSRQREADPQGPRARRLTRWPRPREAAPFEALRAPRGAARIAGCITPPAWPSPRRSPPCSHRPACCTCAGLRSSSPSSRHRSATHAAGSALRGWPSSRARPPWPSRARAASVGSRRRLSSSACSRAT